MDELTKREATKYTVYRVYYGDRVVYVGRTSQNIEGFVKTLVTGKSKLDVDKITEIDSHVFTNDADSRLYCLYETVRLKPEENYDVSDDIPEVSLPDIEWTGVWKSDKNYARLAKEHQNRLRILEKRLKELNRFYTEFEGRYKRGNITLEDYMMFNNALDTENLIIRRQMDKEW